MVTEKIVWPWDAPTGYGFWAKLLPVFVEVLVDFFAVEEGPELCWDPFSFLVFELEVEPLGVLRTTIVDLVPMPAWMWLTAWPRERVLR